MKRKDITDILKLFWKMSICIFKKHKVSDKDWNMLTPLLPEIDANCVRCGFPFIISLEKDGKYKSREKYPDEGGF